jgi:ABC-type lipoprotein export system ATPase subunit
VGAATKRHATNPAVALADVPSANLDTANADALSRLARAAHRVDAQRAQMTLRFDEIRVN